MLCDSRQAFRRGGISNTTTWSTRVIYTLQRTTKLSENSRGGSLVWKFLYGRYDRIDWEGFETMMCASEEYVLILISIWFWGVISLSRHRWTQKSSIFPKQILGKSFFPFVMYLEATLRVLPRSRFRWECFRILAYFYGRLKEERDETSPVKEGLKMAWKGLCERINSCSCPPWGMRGMVTNKETC